MGGGGPRRDSGLNPGRVRSYAHPSGTELLDRKFAPKATVKGRWGEGRLAAAVLPEVRAEPSFVRADDNKRPNYGGIVCKAGK